LIGVKSMLIQTYCSINTTIIMVIY